VPGCPTSSLARDRWLDRNPPGGNRSPRSHLTLAEDISRLLKRDRSERGMLKPRRAALNFAQGPGAAEFYSMWAGLAALCRNLILNWSAPTLQFRKQFPVDKMGNGTPTVTSLGMLQADIPPDARRSRSIAALIAGGEAALPRDRAAEILIPTGCWRAPPNA